MDAPDRPTGTPQASCSRRQPAQSCSDAASPPQPSPHADLQRQQTLAAQRTERRSTAAQLHSIKTPARQTKGSLKQLSTRFSSTASRAVSLSLLLSKLARQTRNHYKRAVAVSRCGCFRTMLSLLVTQTCSDWSEKRRSAWHIASFWGLGTHAEPARPLHVYLLRI